MEGESEESDEDVQGENKPTVLWEKCIQQSIFVDLSEDESLHLSDLESSLVLHFSQEESAASETSIHLSGSAELSALDDTSSESSVVGSQSERMAESKNKSSILHLSAQRPNTTQNELPLKEDYEDPGQNTSDEDQEELPYDSDLGSHYFNQIVSPDAPVLLESPTTDSNDFNECLVSVECHSEKLTTLLKEATNTKQSDLCHAFKANEVAPFCPSTVDINQLLLRHFSQEELLLSGRLIEAETLPEVSLLESVDDTVLSLVLTHKSTAESPCNSEIDQSSCPGVAVEKSYSASKNSNLAEEPESKIDNVDTAATDSIASRSASTDNDSWRDNSALDVVEQQKAEEVAQDSKVPFVRTRSFSEIKYGQGQVHYPLPDFSKVAPKVKIPKAPSGPARPVPQSPSIMHRAQSSPGMLEVISRVLEDSILPSEKPYVFKHEDKQTPPALVHHLQAEYDKLLTKYAEAENLIDQMRLGTNTQSPSEMIAYSDTEYHQHELNDDDHQENPVERSHLGSLASHLPPSEIIVEKGETAAQSNIKGVNKASPSKVQEGLSDGDRMTTELSDIISHFMQKVKDFKLSVSNMSVSTAEQQMMLRSMMEAQDQLERKYISKKEEHRALEMQNYMGLSRNTGTFDPDRLVEGDIFRIGMHLEDIKEMIDKNVCEQISPPHSSSTPTSMKEMLHVKPSALCISTPSSPPSLHEGPSASFSAARYNMEIQKVEGKQEGVEETSMAHADGGLEQSCKVMSADSFLRCNSCPSWSPHSSLEDLNTQAAEDEDGNEEERNSVSSEGIDHTNILAYLSGSSSTSLQREWTPDSCNTLDSVLNPEGEHVGLAVEVSCSSYTPRDSDSHSPLEPLLITSSRIVSPETDSGFGSSYLNQSGSGSYPPNLLTESVETHNEILGSSDSEGSCFNLQTAIHSVSLTSQQRTSPHPSVQTQVPGEAAAVECRVDSATKEPPERQQRSDANLPAQIHNHISASVVSTTMDTEKICSQTHCCSCNGEAILALQSEVSRLKKNLEEGLVQLPHLAQKMDYLTSKYKQDRQESRSKTRPRIHQRPATNSVWSGSGQNRCNIISGSAKIEDWISSDMEPSRSKDSGDTADSDLMLEFCNSPVGGRRGSGIHSEPEFECRPHQTLKSCRGLEGSVKTFSRSSSKGGKAGVAVKDAKQRARTAIMEHFYSKERRPSFSSPSLQKPLLQVNYGSSSSLPASYKVREIPQQSTSHHRKRSTQSDTALLPSNVYFQRTLSPVSVPSKTSSRTGRHKGSKEEDMNRTLDKAIEVARSMKRTTDRMAKRLSADLAKAQLYRKLHNIQPLGGGNHHTL